MEGSRVAGGTGRHAGGAVAAGLAGPSRRDRRCVPLSELYAVAPERILYRIVEPGPTVAAALSTSSPGIDTDGGAPCATTASSPTPAEMYHRVERNALAGTLGPERGDSRQ